MKNISGSDTLGISKFYIKTNRFSAREFEDLLSLRFLDKNGSIKQEYRMVHETCPVCFTKLTESVQLFVKSGYIHWKCSNCESIFTNPTLKDEVISKHVYGITEYPFLDSVNSEIQISFDKLRFSRALEILVKSGMPFKEKTVFDFGTGSGFFLSLCRELGFKKLFGNDLLLQAVEMSRRVYHLNDVIEKDGLMDLDRIDKNVSLIALWEFLDHINKPKIFLSRLIDKIESGTYILISVRNSDSLAARVLRANCNMFLGHAHFNFWSNKAIDGIAQEYNLELIDKYQYISERDAVCNFLNYHEPYKGGRNELSWIPSIDEIIKLKLGYKHVIILKKI